MDYLKIRDSLAKELQGIPGILSVGLTKKDGKISLLVAVDSEKYQGNYTYIFGGLQVIVKDLGKPQLY